MVALAAGTDDHGDLDGLLDDDHTQYLLLAGRTGGQTAIGSPTAAQALTLQGSSAGGDLGFVDIASPQRVTYNSFDDTQQFCVLWDETANINGSYVGGFLSVSPTHNVTTGVWIPATFSDTMQANIGATPGFSAYTFINQLSTIQNNGNFNLPSGLVMNVGLTHARTTSGTSTTAGVTGVSLASQTRATTSGAVMTRTGITGIAMRPTFSTVSGSTVNLGTIVGVDCFQPAVALFQPQAGVENMTAYYGIRMPNITFGGASRVVNVINSALAAATNVRVINSTGTAESDHAGNFNLTSDFPNGTLRIGATGGATDFQMGWVGGTNQLFLQIGTPAISQIRWSSPSTDRWLTQHALGGGEFNWNCDRFSLGSQTGANGNQVGNFVTPARTIGVSGEWADFLLTQGGNLTVGGLSMSRVSAWVINGVSYASSSGTVTNADTLTVGGFPTSAPGVTITERQSLHVIAGRSRFQSAMQYDPINPSTLAAGNNNNWAGLLTGTNNNNMRHWARVTPDAGGTSAVTGIDSTQAQDGDCFKLTNVGTAAMTLNHQDANSSASNRIISPTGANYTLGADESAEIIWDDTTDRWRILYGSGA